MGGYSYTLPETRSCELEKAPEFQAVMRDARARAFQVLLVHKLDRRLGVQVRSVCENLGESIMDRAMEGMLEVMAEWYGGNLGPETRKGHRALTRKGFGTGGKVPFGYRAEPVMGGTRQRSRLVPCLVTGPVMAEVFRLYSEGVATTKILSRVEALTGSRWTPATLYTRLRNPRCSGRLLYGLTSLPQGRPRRAGEEVTEGEVPALVDEATWQRANCRLREKGKKRPAVARIETQRSVGRADCERREFGVF